MVLNEKGIPFRTQFVNIASGEQYENWYLKINPKGEVPVIKDGDTIVIDSARIINYLEDGSSYREYRKLRPTEEGEDVIEVHNNLHKIIHDLPADVITIGSFYHQDLVGRAKMPFVLPVRRHMKNITERTPEKLRKIASGLTDSPEIAEELNNKAARLERELAVMKDVEQFKKVLDTVDGVLAQVEEQLAKNQGQEKWLVSEAFTVADIDLTILLERLNVLGLERRFWGSRPHITDYWAKVRQRDSYKNSMPTTFFHLKTFIKSITYVQLI